MSAPHVFRSVTDRIVKVVSFPRDPTKVLSWGKQDAQGDDVPVFDRRFTASVDPNARAGLDGSGAYHPGFRRTDKDRPQGRLVTACLLGDPPAHRAGRTPPSEESREIEELMEVYRELGRPPPDNERALAVQAGRLAELKEERERLRPRRYIPPAMRRAAE